MGAGPPHSALVFGSSSSTRVVFANVAGGKPTESPQKNISDAGAPAHIPRG